MGGGRGGSYSGIELLFGRGNSNAHYRGSGRGGWGGPPGRGGKNKGKEEDDRDKKEEKKIEKIYTDNVNKLYKIIDKVFENPTPELVNTCLENGTLAKFLERLSDLTGEAKRFKRTR